MSTWEETGAEAPIHFAGATLDRYRHVCAFFNGDEEEQRVLGPFVQEGFTHGEKAFHIVDPAQRTSYLQRFADWGIDPVGTQDRGQLEVRTWDEAYLRGGHFDQDAMLALIEEVLRNGPTQGFPRTRLVAHMEWALEDRPGVDDLVVYETRLNFVLPRYRDPVF
ncbi:MAG: hypothetical protein QOF51_3454 [Chloroflexota bacterium]|jgi:hypothetical protein|nr:hypothetical protein [Chloroflexota bacterium]